MTYSTDKIAKFFVEKANSQKIETPERILGEGITHLKLQKLMYFANAYFLVKTGKPLLDETFQAWALGPVLKTLYKKLNHLGNKNITNKEIKETTQDIDTKTLTILNSVWKDMGKFSAFELVRLAHEHGPRKDFYKEGISDIEIPNDIIKKQFSKIFID